MNPNRTTFDRTVQIAETAEQLMKEGKAPTIVQALKLLEIATLQEIAGELSGIASSLDSIDAVLTVK